MLKNVAGQTVGCQMTRLSDGTEFKDQVTCLIGGDGAANVTGAVGFGICSHKGDGFHEYTPSQAETNYNRVQFVFHGNDAITATVQVYPDTLIQAIKAKTDLLNPAPTGSVLLVSSGLYYCTRQDVELVFGIKNVIAWADLDNSGDVTFIEDRVTTMIALAHEQTNDALRAGSYTIPIVNPVPTSLTYHVAALAGVLLYESRGAMDADTDDGTHRLTPFRKRWDTYIKNVLGRKVVLSAGRAISNNAPSVS